MMLIWRPSTWNLATVDLKSGDHRPEIWRPSTRNLATVDPKSGDRRPEICRPNNCKSGDPFALEMPSRRPTGHRMHSAHYWGMLIDKFVHMDSFDSLLMKLSVAGKRKGADFFWRSDAGCTTKQKDTDIDWKTNEVIGMPPVATWVPLFLQLIS